MDTGAAVTKLHCQQQQTLATSLGAELILVGVVETEVASGNANWSNDMLTRSTPVLLSA
jgi:hypothetical protein